MSVHLSSSNRPKNHKPVLIDGQRSAFVKSFGVFEDADALFLFSRVVDAVIRKNNIPSECIDEVIAGAVIPQTKNPNVARDTILNLGLSAHIHGYTLNRACTSSLQSIADASRSILAGHTQMILAGGVECLSDVPIVYSKAARKFLVKMSRAKSITEKLSMFTQFSAAAWLPKSPALAEPLTGLTMGEHAEVMAKLNKISRKDQDLFALSSHKKAHLAQEAGKFNEEICAIFPMNRNNAGVQKDNIIRSDVSLDALAGLRPAFDRKYGTITAGNASPLTDGAAVSLIADEAYAKSLGLKPKAYIKDFCFVGVDPMEQLLIGPAIAIPKLLKRNNLNISDIDLFEIHEAFAAQVLSCLRSMESGDFMEKYFGSNQAFGTIPEEKLNINGGAIAIGHPFGATGSRLINSLANELIRSDKQLGVVAICAAGGMAGVALIERCS